MGPLPLIYGNVHREKMNELDDLRPGNARRESAGAGGMVKDPEDLWQSMAIHEKDSHYDGDMEDNFGYPEKNMASTSINTQFGILRQVLMEKLNRESIEAFFFFGWRGFCGSCKRSMFFHHKNHGDFWVPSLGISSEKPMGISALHKWG